VRETLIDLITRVPRHSTFSISYLDLAKTAPTLLVPGLNPGPTGTSPEPDTASGNVYVLYCRAVGVHLCLPRYNLKGNPKLDYLIIFAMKPNKAFSFFLLPIAFLIVLLFEGCKKEKNPTLITVDISSIAQTSAISGGEITSQGSSSVILKGVCWSISIEPTILDNKTTDGDGIASFTSNMTGLNPKTTYFVRAYATNGSGTGYGSSKSFTTDPASIANISTSVITSITQTTAISGGTITSDGASQITERGLCWNTSQNPTISDNKTSSGTGIGTFSITITGLVGNTNYYVRAYATNSVGTSYGNEQSFKTNPLLPSFTSSSIASFTTNSGTIKVAITSDGGASISSKGVCYSTTQSPTILDSKTTDGTGIASYLSYIVGLQNNTTYYIRAYAVNSAGVQYGAQLSSKTLSQIADIDGNTYNITSIGTQVWMAENLKTSKLNDGSLIPNVVNDGDWYSLVSPGYAWYNHDASSYKNPYGALYNWYVANSTKICPQGWHVPSDNEWLVLINYLTDNVANKLKETGSLHWVSPNSGATNESGFSGLPGGWRFNGGGFSGLNYNGRYWSSTEFSTSQAYVRCLDYGNQDFYRNNDTKVTGYSIRCVKD
jgi:uncharacterized protein (TIGR02145 family)